MSVTAGKRRSWRMDRGSTNMRFSHKPAVFVRTWTADRRLETRERESSAGVGAACSWRLRGSVSGTPNSTSTKMSAPKTARKYMVLRQPKAPMSAMVPAPTACTEAAGVYCLTAHDAHHAHLYLIVFKTISTFLALLAVLRTTLPVRAEVKKHRAMTKLWAFKALIFLQVAQDFIFSIVNSNAPRSITESKTVSRIDFLTGIPSLVVEIELVVFALFFHYAYSVSMYQLSDEQKRAGEHYAGYGWRLIYKVFDIRDVLALIGFAFRFRKEVEMYEMEMRGRETSVSELPQSNPALLDNSSTQDLKDAKLPHEQLTEMPVPGNK
ncbi:hypothetical protein NUW58_g8348 [Xylaria curta]|uniref:Uncharacterized protein n=1 Tax=Xylaria curta TaxID=42375 RepID=A0ACC1N862_9PEZI|nr:hypothetical protein NUW58_g8348 [Xylaria curta]